MPDAPSNANPDFLVIGYGNTLRQDDQAGPLVAELVGEQRLPRVRALPCPQLWPEHAEALVGAGTVVFVDADASLGALGLRRIRAGESSQVTTHAVEPRTLLALAREVYGVAPSAWMLTVPARNFGFGTDLSDVTARGIWLAVAKVIELWENSPAPAADRRRGIRRGGRVDALPEWPVPGPVAHPVALDR